MKKNNLTFVLFLLITSCSERKAPTMISHWAKANNFTATPTRTVANTFQNQCLKNNFTVDLLKSQVKELESSFEKAPRVKGTWRHLNLATLPVPQANFLKTYGNMIGDLQNKDAFDYSSCTDVPCLFNKIYGREDDVAGYVHYLWYLRFNHMLSADNMMPENMDNWGRKLKEKQAGIHNGRQTPFEDYLYNDDELYGLWRLSMMLKTPQTNLVYLEEIQRVPRGQNIEGKDANTCGIAYSGGWIQLNDGCLTIYPGKDTGYLYQAVTHEMNHQLDFQLGRGSKEFYRSQQEDYLSVAGMFIKEYVDESGQTVRQWDMVPDSKIVTPYAGTLPQENFAETLSIFRVDGDLARKNTRPGHFDYVSKNFYSNQSFEKKSLIKNWISKRTADLNQSVLKAVVDCSKSKSSFKSRFFALDDFSVQVLPNMLNCISKKSEEISELLATEVSMKEPEGCSTLNARDVGNSWDEDMRSSLKVLFDKYLKDLNNDKDYVAKIESYYNGLSDNTVSMDAYVNCYKESNETKCFSDEIRRNLTKKAEELNLADEQVEEYIQLYFSQHTFNQIKDETLKAYQTYLASNQDKIRAGADLTWETCKNIPQNDDASPRGNFFTVSGYLVSSFYNCLNSQTPTAVKNIVKDLSEKDFQIKNGKEELILSDNIMPEFVKFLGDTYQSEKNQEAEKAKEFIAADDGSLKKTILSDMGWISNALKPEMMKSDCRVKALKEMSFLPLYHMKSELFEEFVDTNICNDINQTTEFNKWLQDSKGPYVDRILASVKERLYEDGSVKAKECLGIYPMDNMINKIRYKKQRENCLIDSWSSVEAGVSKKVLEDPISVRFGLSASEVRTEIITARELVQNKLKKDYFKIDVKIDVPFFR